MSGVKERRRSWNKVKGPKKRGWGGGYQEKKKPGNNARLY
jgi:hypothetical protein